MPRILLLSVFAAVLLVLPGAGHATSGRDVDLCGTVGAKDVPHRLVSVRAPRTSALLRVRGSLQRVHTGQRVELRGSTLRSAGSAPRVLARGVSIVRLRVDATESTQPNDDDRAENQKEDDNDDELEVKGTIVSLSPLTVSTPAGPKTCVVPAGVTLTGFAVHDVVEMTCDLEQGVLVLRKLELEDEDDDTAANDDHRGPGHGADDHGSRGSGSGDDSGHGGGGG